MINLKKLTWVIISKMFNIYEKHVKYWQHI